MTVFQTHGPSLIFIFSVLYFSYFFVISLFHCRPSLDVAQIEESAGQKLLDMEEEKKQREKELEGLEEQLRQCTARSQITDSELQYLFIRLCCCMENAT